MVAGMVAVADTKTTGLKTMNRVLLPEPLPPSSRIRVFTLANFLYAFSVFEFVSICVIRGKNLAESVFLVATNKIANFPHGVLIVSTRVEYTGVCSSF
jgi:hypothetical protein